MILKAFLVTLSYWSCSASSTVEVSFAREILRPPASALAINVEEIALALRWTGEMNRRLYFASRNQPGVQTILREEEQWAPKSLDPFRGGQASVYRIAPGPNTPARDTLSVFHAKHPSNDKNGARRWGPDLSQYLQTLVAILSHGEDKASRKEVSSMELTLAMMYMDRACSVETPRSDGHSPCPYCTPRTVHRLTVAALLVAIESERGPHGSESLHQKVSDALRIPQLELEQMIDWLRGALGDQGTHVATEQLEDFVQIWTSRFGVTPPAATVHAAYEPLVTKEFIPLYSQDKTGSPSRSSVFA